MKILEKAHKEVSLNDLVFWLPTTYLQGLGEFTHEGSGWWLKVNPKLAAYREDLANNLLDFLGMAIAIWLSLIECQELNLIDKMILILGDNTCVIFWILKSGLNTKSIYRNTVLFITRTIPDLVIESKNFIDSKKLPGVLNLISD